MLESSAAALGNLAYYNDMNRIRIAEVTPIHDFQETTHVADGRSICRGFAVSLLLTPSTSCRHSLQMGGLAALAQLCESTSSESVLESAVGALRHVVYNNESNRIRFVKIGGLELLVKLAKNCESEVVLESATAMLRKAVASPEIAHTLIEAGALPALAKLESEWIGTVQSYASATLKCLDKHCRKHWSNPSGQAQPTAAYMLLPCAHPSSMTPEIR